MSERVTLSHRVAFELVELAAAATSHEALLVSAFEHIERSLGFDSASFASARGDDWVPFRKEASTIALCAAGSGQIKRETLMFDERARSSRDVLLASEVYTAAQCERLHLFANFLRPCKITSVIAVFLRCRGVTERFLTFSRYGGKPFESRDLELLRALQPTLGLALRAPEPTSTPQADTAVSAMLSERERELVMFVGRGLYNHEIAALLGTSAFTVRNQLSRVYRKLEVSNRAELVARGAELGLLLA
jgi:DNA-binding CsgD family transcriptional regulator